MLPQRRFPEGLDGNFTAYLPRPFTRFDLRLASAPAEAVGFPRKITYAGLRPGLTTPVPLHFMAEYRPRLESFIHAEPCRKLTYTWVGGGRFHVDVLHNRQTGEWNIYKFSSGRLVNHVCGQGYGEALIRASGLGLAAAEPAFIFAGDPEERRRENRAQAEWTNPLDSEGAQGLEASEDPAAHTLVFGAVPSARGASLVFVPRNRARELAAMHEALAARTWGEFRLKLPNRFLPELLRRFRKYGAWASFDAFCQAYGPSTRAERDALWERYEKLTPGERFPLDHDPFCREALPGSGQGDWPESPSFAMQRWLPPAICARWGQHVFDQDGIQVTFNPSHAPEILAALEEAGYGCCWDEDLVRRACGSRSQMQL